LIPKSLACQCERYACTLVLMHKILSDTIIVRFIVWSTIVLPGGGPKGYMSGLKSLSLSHIMARIVLETASISSHSTRPRAIVVNMGWSTGV